MALRVVTVKSAGGDYSSLNAAYVGEGGDLTSLDRQLRIDCSAFVDTTQASRPGTFTTDATRFVTIQAVDNHLGLFGGVGGTAAYSNTGGIDAPASFSRLVGLSSSSAGGGEPFNASTFSGLTDVLFDRCIARGAPFAGASFNIGSTNAFAINCLAILSGATLTGFQGGTTLSNCTAACSAGALGFNGSTSRGINCLYANVDGVTGLGFSGTWTAGSATCASSDASVPSAGVGHLASQIITFVDSANGNYRPPSTDRVLYAAGSDLSADAAYAFSTDITGATRTGGWDIGPFAMMHAAATTWTLNDSGLLPLDQTFAAAAIAGSFGPDVAPWELQPYSTAATAFSQRSDFWPLSMLLEFPSTGTTASGSVAVSLALAGTAQQKITGTGSVAVAPRLSVSGTGQQKHTGTGSVAVVESLSGTAQQKHTASGTVAVVETLSGTGLRGNVGAIATGGVSVLETLSGAAQQIHAATGDARVAPSLSSTGQQQHSASGDLPLALTLSGSASVPAVSITGSGDVAVAFTLDGLADTTTPRRSAGFMYPIRTPTQHVQGDGNIDVALSLGGSAGIAHHASGGVSIRLRVDGVSVTLDPGPEFNPPVVPPLVATRVGAPVIAAPEPPQQQVTGSGNVNLAPRIGGSAQLAHHAIGGVALEAILGGRGQLKNSGRGSVRVSPALSGRGGQSHTAAGHVSIDYATLGLGRVWTPELEAQERVEEEDTDTMAVIAALYYGML